MVSAADGVIGGDPTEVALRRRSGAGDSSDSVVFQRRAQRERNHGRKKKRARQQLGKAGPKSMVWDMALEWRSETVMRPWMILPVGTQGLEPWTDEL